MKAVEPSGATVGIVILISMIAAFGPAILGCTPSSGSDPSSSVETRADELSCELALLRLDKLIETRASEPSFSAAALAEARAIYHMGQELYLQQEYELALQLIEEGIQLVE